MKRKGQVFDGFIVLIALVAIVTTIFALFFINKQLTATFDNPLTFMNVKSEAREAHFYIQSSAELATQQAIYETLKELPVSSTTTCSVSPDNPIVFDNDCALGDVEKSFSEKFKPAFTKYLQGYESTFKEIEEGSVQPEQFSKNIQELSADTFELKFAENRLDVKANNRIQYTYKAATYEVDPSFDIELKLSPEEISELYTKVKSAFDECSKDNALVACLQGKELSSEKLALANIKAEGVNIVVFTFTTKDKFFFSEGSLKYGQITFSFAFSKG